MYPNPYQWMHSVILWVISKIDNLSASQQGCGSEDGLDAHF